VSDSHITQILEGDLCRCGECTLMRRCQYCYIGGVYLHRCQECRERMQRDELENVNASHINSVTITESETCITISGTWEYPQ
jgi:hypothetical protein